MTSSISYRLDTPEGFEIWLIPRENDALRCRVFFQSTEVGMEFINDKMGKAGWMKLSDKIKEIYQPTKETKNG